MALWYFSRSAESSISFQIGSNIHSYLLGPGDTKGSHVDRAIERRRRSSQLPHCIMKQDEESWPILFLLASCWSPFSLMKCMTKQNLSEILLFLLNLGCEYDRAQCSRPPYIFLSSRS